MEEFKPDNDLRPDVSDRRPSRTTGSRHSKSAFGQFRLPLSRQHMMMIVGIVILLLIVLGIGSALNGPAKSPATHGESREIQLEGESSSQTQTSQPSEGQQAASSTTTAPQELEGSPISSTPTEAATPTVPEGQKRVELPGSISDALSQQPGTAEDLTSGAVSSEPGLPTEPATLAAGSAPVEPTPPKVAAKPVEKTVPVKGKETVQSSKAPTAVSGQGVPVGKPVSGSVSGLQNAPASAFTLQLSGASQPATLNAFARKNNLTQYWVYETRRDGKPWYVLVSGTYATSAEAKQAVSSLPPEVQAAQPWVKPVRQVQQELKQR